MAQTKKILQIHFEFTHFSFFLTLFGIETINTFIHRPVVPPKTIPVFGPKRAKNFTRWGVTYLYSLYKGVRVPPPPPPPGVEREIRFSRAKLLYIGDWYIWIIIKHARVLSILFKPLEGVRIKEESVLSGLNLEKM